MTTVAAPRVRPSLRRWAIVACVVLVPAAVHAIWDQIEANGFARYVQSLRDRGEPVDLRDERRPLASAQEREASRLYYAAGILAADSLPPATFPRQPALPKSRDALVDDLRALAAEDIPTATRDARLAAIDEYVRDGEPQLGLIDRASSLTFTRFSPERAEYSYLASDLSTLSALSSLRTDARSLRGDPSAADALFATLELQRVGGTVPWRSAGNWTAGSLRLLLERTRPDADALARLQKGYENVAAVNSMEAGMIRFRAQLIENVWPTTGRPQFSQRIEPRIGGRFDSAQDSLLFLLLRPWITSRVLAYLHQMDDAVRVAREPFPARLAETERRYPDPTFNARGPRPSPWIQWIQMRTHLPVWTNPEGLISALSVRTAARAAAQNRVAIVALAIERWRRAHDGAPPAVLRALTPTYLSAVPDDPFTGSPLRYAVDNSGYVVYSVGVNRKDDGGDIGEWQPDLRQNYPPAPENDIGIRVPLKPRT